MKAHGDAQSAGATLSPLDQTGRLQAQLDALNAAVMLERKALALFDRLSVTPPPSLKSDLAAISTLKPNTVVVSDRDRLAKAKAEVAAFASGRCNTILDVSGILNLNSSGN
jgi:hypothetical protein